MIIEKNQICKKEGHDFKHSKIYDGMVYCFSCGVYKDVRQLRKEDEKKIIGEHK
jgi:ribosomal protein S26